MKNSMIYYKIWYKKEEIGQTDEISSADMNTDENIAARQKFIDEHAAENGIDPASEFYTMSMHTNEPVME